MTREFSNQQHLYYGTVNVAHVAQIKQTSLNGGQGSSAGEVQNERELVELSASAREHQAKLDMFDLQQSARVAPAPTSDHDVKMKLREFDEPICLFGEGPYERRERLRLLMARRAHRTTSTLAREVVMVDASSKPEIVQARLFFTEGSDELVAARKWISRYSLPRAIKRLKIDRKRYDTEDPFEVEGHINEHNRKLRTGLKVISSQVGADRPLASGRFSPDDQYFATVSWSPIVKVWTIPGCDSYATLTGHKERVHAVAWHPCFRSSSSPPSYGTLCEKNQVGDNEKEGENVGNHLNGASLETNDSLSSEGCHLATGGSDLSIHLWNISRPNKPIAVLEGHEERINRVEFHPSGRYIASTSHDETWRLWDVETQKELLLQEGHSTGVYALKFHVDGSIVVTGDLGGLVRVWDLRTGRTVLPLQGHVRQVLGISLNPRMPNQIATCSDDNTVRVWDLRKERCVDTLLAHDKLISEVVFEPRYGRFLVTSSYDCTLKVWNSVDLSCTRTLLGHEARVMGTDISNDSQFIASVSFDHTFKLWCCDPEAV